MVEDYHKPPKMTLDVSKAIWEEYASTILSNFALKLRNASADAKITLIAKEMDEFEMNFNRKKK